MDKSTFTQRILESEATLFRVAKSIVVNDRDCEDAVQNAILKAYEKLDSLKSEQYFKTWLVRILINECYNLTRFRITEVSYEDYSKSEPIDSCQDYSELYSAICALKPRIRMTIILYYLEGYSVEEIKSILKIPAGTVKSRLSKGRTLLKSTLEPRGFIHE